MRLIRERGREGEECSAPSQDLLGSEPISSFPQYIIRVRYCCQTKFLKCHRRRESNQFFLHCVVAIFNHFKRGRAPRAQLYKRAKNTQFVHEEKERQKKIKTNKRNSCRRHQQKATLQSLPNPTQNTNLLLFNLIRSQSRMQKKNKQRETKKKKNEITRSDRKIQY